MDLLDPDRWQRVSPYLDQALDLDEAARAGWLHALRATHPDEARDVERLLAVHASAESARFLDAPAMPLGSDTPAPTAMDAGTRLGAYRLVSRVGQGGMGTVWLADRADGRYEGRAAIKQLTRTFVDAAGRERFAREGSILATLHHPHIASLLDAGVTPDGQPYLVLEYVEGTPIDRHCEAQALDVAARLRLFLDVLDAVGHAHAALIVHRDLKPSNVLVRTDGQVKLLDFGIAKLLAAPDAPAVAALTVDGAYVLTPDYASPEQLTGAPITVATDVYALGVLLYVLLGGRHPSGDTRTPAVRFKAILETDPPPPSEVVPTGPLQRTLRGDLDTIVGKALRKAPDDRYPSVAAFADDIRRYLAHEPVRARPQTWRYRTRKFVRRHAAGVVTGLVMLVVLVSVVAFYTTRLARERDRARTEADRARQVSTLMTDLLTAADPYARRGNQEPTVRSVLDAGAERVRRDLADRPDLQADLLTVIGRAYGRLGASDRARVLLEEALTRARKAYGADDARVAETLNDLGVALAREGDAAAAAPLLDEAIAIRRRTLGLVHPALAVTLVERGRLHVDAGKRSEAEALFRESLAIRRTALGPHHNETSTSLSELGLLLWGAGDAAGAEPLLREALAISRATLGTDHPNVSTGLNNVALVLGAQGNWAEAEAAQRESIDIARRVLGPRHRDIGPKLANLAVALLEQGRLDEADRVLDEAVSITQEHTGAEHPGMAGYRFLQARVRLGQRRGTDAERVLRGVVEVRQRTLPPGSWRIGQAQSALAEALALQQRRTEAIALLHEALQTLPPAPGQPGREHALATARLGALDAQP